jgi:ribosome-associated protein
MKESLAKKPTDKTREHAEILIRAALSKKARNPVLLNLEGLSSLTDYFLILSGATERQVTAISEAVVDAAKRARIKPYSKEGISQGNWALLDYGDIIVHVFRPSVREFYDLEGLWAEAEREEFSDDLKREIDATSEIEDEWDDFE